MSATIAVEDLRVGMFVMLDGGWLSHPFPLSSFRITTQEQLSTLRGLGLQQVRWSPEKSEPLDEPAAGADGASSAGPVADDATSAAPHQAQEAAAAAALRKRGLQQQLESSQRCERQHAEAVKAWRESIDLVTARPQHAAQQSEALTRALLDRMLTDDDIAIRLVAAVAIASPRTRSTSA